MLLDIGPCLLGTKMSRVYRHVLLSKCVALICRHYNLACLFQRARFQVYGIEDAILHCELSDMGLLLPGITASGWDLSAALL